MDQIDCRFRCKAFGAHLMSVGLGPLSGNNRKGALVRALDEIRAAAGIARPPTAFVGAVPWEQWDGALDARDEQPQRFLCERF